MNFNNLRLRSRTWLDVQSLTSFLVRVPPAAIAKWCLTNTTSKQRGGVCRVCHLLFVCQLQT